MSANDTPESNNIGLIVAHTMTPAIINEYGSYALKDLKGMSGWDALSASEALIPFQSEMDSDRLVMATTH